MERSRKGGRHSSIQLKPAAAAVDAISQAQTSSTVELLNLTNES